MKAMSTWTSPDSMASDTAAVTAHDGKAFQFAVGNGFTNLAAHAGSLDVRDGAIFDHRDNRGLGLTQGSRANGQVFDAPSCGRLP